MSHPYGPWTETQDTSVSLPYHTLTNYFGGNMYENVVTGTYIARTGVRVQRFDKRPKRSSLLKTDVSFKPASARGINSPSSPAYWTSMPQGVWAFRQTEPTYSDPSYFDSRALLKLVRKTEPGWQSLVDVGEFKETKQLVLSSLGLIRDVYHVNGRNLAKRLKKVRPQDTVELGKVVSEALLTYRLGIVPLIHSINDAVETTIKCLNDARYDAKVSAKFVGDPFMNGNKAVTQQSVAGFTCSIENSAEGKVISKYGGTVKPSKANHVIDFRDLFGLRGRHIIPTVYNLLPYSFVLDYVSNVGNLLELAAYQNGFLVDGWHVRVEKVHRVSRCTPLRYYDLSQYPTTVSTVIGTWSRHYFNYLREPIDLDSAISAAARRVELKSPDLLQTATVCALFGARLRGKEIRMPNIGKLPPGFLKSLKISIV